MFDNKMRQFKDTTFDPLARLFHGLPPWLFTILGLCFGLAAAVALWQQQYIWGLFLWAFNRIFDALDGSVARMYDAQSDLGGYLDIVVDFVVYAAIPVGITAGIQEMRVTIALIFLLCTYYVNAASWLYLAAILEKRNASHHHDRLTTIIMPAGIIGGTETILFYTAFILFPSLLTWLFGLMGLLIVATISQRLAWAIRHLT